MTQAQMEVVTWAAQGTPLLARTGSPSSLALWIVESPPTTWELPPLLRIEESPPPCVWIREPWPPQPPARGSPPRALLRNYRRRTRLGGCRR